MIRALVIDAVLALVVGGLRKVGPSLESAS
jgi:hypothetical protein